MQNPAAQLLASTVKDEVVFGLPDCDVRLYRGVLALLGLGPYEETPPLLLSEGEKKRLALATVLMRPRLSGICLDEPTLGQDEGHRRLLGLVLHRLASAGYLCLVLAALRGAGFFAYLAERR
jgi:energy-coupling factor transport system ATP-binding protein